MSTEGSTRLMSTQRRDAAREARERKAERESTKAVDRFLAAVLMVCLAAGVVWLFVGSL